MFVSSDNIVSQFLWLDWLGMNQKKQSKLKGMFQNLTCRTHYEHEIIIFMPIID